MYRFEVFSPDGAKMSQEKFLEDVLQSAFANKFEYDRYFNKCNSTIARMDYLIEAFGGDIVAVNNKMIAEKIKERAILGGQKKLQQNLYTEDFPFDPDTLTSTYELYKEERPVEMAHTAVEVYERGNLVDVEALEQEAELWREVVKKRTMWEETLFEKQAREVEINAQILALRNELKDIKVDKKNCDIALAELDHEAYTQLGNIEVELQEGIAKNEEVRKGSNKVFQEAITDITDFNTKRSLFFRAVKAFKEYQRLEKEWNELDQSITDLKQENKDIFINAIPLPELTIDFDDKGAAIPMYKGREFKLGNLSTGESLEITSRIQDVLNPGGNNFILIDRGQDLGSKIDDVMEYCEKKQIQAIVEITKRDEKFKIVVSNDAKSV
jgi:hypothetical protein